MTNLFDLVATLRLDTTQYDTAINGADDKTGKLGKRFSTLKKVGIATFAALGAVAVKFTKDALQAGADFDQAMSQVGATMGKTMSELESETGSVDLAWGKFNGTLRDFAKEMGAHTAFTATECAEALNYMALAGYDTQKSMEMLPTVLNLAAAGNIDLARASDMVTDTQTAFGLSTERTTQLIDEMAKASSTGNTSVEQLGEAFLTIGGLAKELNGGFVTLADGTLAEVDGVQELEIAFTAMANAGVKGSEAGTHMRNMLLKLSSPTADGVAQLEALGVSIYDNEGRMRSLSNIMGDLSASMENLTQEEKMQAISDLFNARDMASVEALLGAVNQDWDAIGESILNAEGSAQRMADTQLDNLAGDITIFKSALEGVQIAFSDKLTPALRNFVQLGTSGLDSINSLFKSSSISDFVANLNDMLGESIDSIGNWTSSLAPKIFDMSNVVIDAFATLSSTIFEKLGGLAENLPEIFSELLPKITELSGHIREKAGDFISAGLELLKKLAQGFAEGLPTFIQNIPTIVSNIAGIINDNAPKVLSAGFYIIVTLVKGIIKAIPTIIQNLPKIVKAIFDVITAVNWLNLGKTVIEGIGKGIKSMFNYIKANGKDIAIGLLNAIKNGLVGIATLGVNAVKALGSGIIKLAGFLAGKGKELILALVSAVRNKLSDFASIGKNLVEGLWNGISDKAKWIKDKIAGWVGDIKSFFKRLFGISSPSKWARDVIGGNIVKGLADGLINGENLVQNAFDSIMPEYDGDYAMSIDRPASSFGGTQIVNYITVDGAENPEDFADRFVRKLRMDMRTV